MTLPVADRMAIHELLALHGHLVDAGELDRMGELFTADVVYDVTSFGFGELHGHEAIRSAALALGDRNPVGHHVTNVHVTEDADGTVRAVWREPPSARVENAGRGLDRIGGTHHARSTVQAG